MAEDIDRLKAALADRYTIEGEVGSGGMATVYLAKDLKHERQVAVKVLRPDLAAALGSDRFLREIKITAQLNHPHILPLLDSGEAEEFLYYVMPLVAGESLRRLLIREKRLQLNDALRITQQVASALDHASRHGVVHRDVKPENILFSEGHAIVADFGIAKAVSRAGGEGLTRSGFPMGTPGYMSPEQAAGITELDPRTDVFGLACVVYEMLLGDTPEMWPTEEAVRLGRFLDASATHRQRLDKLPGRVEQALVKALAIRPGDRFATPGDFADALRAASERSAKLDSRAVREVIGRAAELDAQQPTDAAALSIGGVEQAAAEAGIPPVHVRDAVRELEQLPGSVAATAPAPAVHKLRKGKLLIDRTIDREVPESAYEALVEEIQTTLGFVGTVSGVGKSLYWSGTRPGFVGRDVRITVNRDVGCTRIHIEEHVELRGASVFAPGWGAAGGGLLSLLIITALGTPNEAVPFIVLPLAIGGGISTYKWITGFLARQYGPQLEALADRLAAHIESARRLPERRVERDSPAPAT